MALLNYVDKLSNAGAWNNSKDYRLIFTGDGHITTHGVDYTALFNQSPTLRGLVSSPLEDTPLSLLTSENSWRGIESDITKTSENTDYIPTVGYVHQYLSIVDVMKFKGVITQDGQTYKVTSNGTTTNGFPTICEAGDTYRVSLAGGIDKGSFAGKENAQSGDLLICTKDSTSCTNTSDYWVLVHTNIHGEGSLKINGTSNSIIFYGSGSGTIYAPTGGGTAGQILQARGNNAVPEWVDVTFSDNKLQFGVKEIDLSSLKTTIGALTLQIGGTDVVRYSGSDTVFNVPTASNTVLGVVKIGDNIVHNSGTIGVPLVANTNNGVVPKISDSGIATSGDLILVGDTSSATWKKLPVGVDTWRSIYVGNTELLGTGTNSGSLKFVGNGKTSVTGNGDTISITSSWRDIKIQNTSIEDNVLNLIQGDNITLVNSNGAVTISATDTTYTAGVGLRLNNTEFNLLPATSNTLGGIQLGYTNTDKKYAVQVDSNNKAYVEVPWYNENTWREIRINGTSIGDKILDIRPSEEIHVVVDNDSTTDVYEIGFGLQWYNINTEKYEYV